MLLIIFVLQARRAGGGVGPGISPARDEQPVRRERLCQHQGNGRIHHLILHAPGQVTLLLWSLVSVLLAVGAAASSAALSDLRLMEVTELEQMR